MSKVMRKFLLAVLAPLFVMALLSFGLTAVLVNRFAESERYDQLAREANIIQSAIEGDGDAPREIQAFLTVGEETRLIGRGPRMAFDAPDLSRLKEEDVIEFDGKKQLTYQLKTDDYTITTFREAPLAGRALNGVYLAIGVALLVTLVLASLLAYFVGRNYTRPITELRTVAEKIGTGEAEVTLPVRPNDEVGELIDSVGAMHAQLKEKETMQKSFIAGITHDLRTPLAIIRNETEALAAGIIPVSELSEVTGSIIEETDRLGVLIDETLLYSKLAGKGMPLSRVELDVSELAKQTAERLTETFAEKGVTLALRLEPSIHSVDERAFERVLVNFLMNALAAAPEASTVEFEVTRDMLSVSDAGSGVPIDQRDRIWEMYVKHDGSQGHGLGLAISRLILESHGFGYGVGESKLGGASFYVKFKGE
ncbi:HAMP domain-containing sensor histidine kinase [Exiguobacterium flavidum]|uniref:HAMP domain-containing sensor histidine kinase n=1 Tax=Exiguobacterium flavidum TaxID=2184695 RepID=UPI000DF7C923|nr:HAMP domain-containing sensor histidine kinase [Exiguobacterium flavidum]